MLGGGFGILNCCRMTKKGWKNDSTKTRSNEGRKISLLELLCHISLPGNTYLIGIKNSINTVINLSSLQTHLRVKKYFSSWKLNSSTDI